MQWWIQDLPKVEAPNLVLKSVFLKICIETKKIWPQGACSWRPPWICHCRTCIGGYTLPRLRAWLFNEKKSLNDVNARQRDFPLQLVIPCLFLANDTQLTNHCDPLREHQAIKASPKSMTQNWLITEIEKRQAFCTRNTSRYWWFPRTVLIIFQGTICGYTIQDRQLDMYNNSGEVSGAATSQSDTSRYCVADILTRLSNGEAVTPSVSRFFVHTLFP